MASILRDFQERLNGKGHANSGEAKCEDTDRTCARCTFRHPLCDTVDEEGEHVPHNGREDGNVFDAGRTVPQGESRDDLASPYLQAKPRVWNWEVAR